VSGLGIESRAARLALLATCVLVLAMVGVYFQGGRLGVDYVRTEQLRRHLEVVEGRAGNPTQYRVLSEWLVEKWLRLVDGMGVRDPIVSGFLSFRVLQNIVILALASVYYRRLGLSDFSVLAALGVITWSMTHSLFDSDLSFNLYSDLIFYLAAGLLVLLDRDPWLIPLLGLAALNRETNGLMVVFYLLARYRRGRGWDRRTIVIAACALGVLVAVYAGVRLALGPRALILPHGRTPGLDLFSYNVFRPETWVHLAASWSVFPIIALLAYRQLPSTLRRWLISIPPIWLLLHLFLAVAAEVRIMLMPQLMLFVPAAFIGLQGGGQPTGASVAMDAANRRGADPKPDGAA